MNTAILIRALIDQAIQGELIEDQDRIYATNRLLSLLHLDNLQAADPDPAIGGQTGLLPAERVIDATGDGLKIPDLVDLLVTWAAENHVIEDLFDVREILAADIMNIFVGKPSEINRQFQNLCKQNPRLATDWFYQFSRNTNYIQTNRIARNISYPAATEYGELDITINLSKPEKNPRDIAAAKSIKRTGYPKCLLCVENEGYAGRINYPARANHRLIRMELTGEPWFFQYSPYSYYNEHCIILSAQHRDMRINRDTFRRLLAFLDLFPHYFIGSNADLPIVGGSILVHDHYQGGRYSFAMDRAPIETAFAWPAYPAVEFGLVHWPMSAIRARSHDQAALVDCADHLLKVWRQYSDLSVEIQAYSDRTPHNTITPIARMRDGWYELDLVLRNNRQSEEHPLGIFHPHADVHHIKKENIGLIEVMGLAVLPARLVEELASVETYVRDGVSEVTDKHKDWAGQLRQKVLAEAAPAAATGSTVVTAAEFAATHPARCPSGNSPAAEKSAAGLLSADTVARVVREGVAAKFQRVLTDAGVFKRNAAGQQAFRRFINHLVRE